MTGETDRARIAARLRKCASMLRADNTHLWVVGGKGYEHARDCDSPEHGGCNKLQAVEAMEAAADLLSSAPQGEATAALRALVEKLDADLRAPVEADRTPD